MSLTNTTGDDAEILLEKSLEKIGNILSLINLFDRRRMITSKGDFVEKFTVKPDAKKEFRFCVLEFVGYDDDATEGDDDCPVCILIYRVHLFFQFVDVRPDGSNSSREFTAAVLTLRKDFLESKDVFGESVGGDDPAVIGRYESFTREGFAALDKDSFSGLTGHFQDFLLRVKHYGGSRTERE